MKIEMYNEVSTSPAWPLIRVAEMELVKNGLAFHPVHSPAYNDAVLVSSDVSGIITGFIIYRPDQVKSTWFIILAWVAPERRKLGIHTKLFETLVARARLRGDIRAIECGTHINNHAAQAAFARQGRKKIAVSYEFPIKEYLDGKDPLVIEK